MAKWLKITISIVGLILLSLLGFVVWIGGHNILLPPELQWLKFSFPLFQFLELIAYRYLFWTALVFFILILIGIIVITFLPRTYSEFKLEDNKGKLYLKKSAIEGFVKSKVAEQKYLKNPSVTTKLYKNKFVVKVSGEANRQYDILGRATLLQTQIESDLKDLFGLNKKIHFEVKVKQVEPRQIRKAKSNRRVQ